MILVESMPGFPSFALTSITGMLFSHQPSKNWGAKPKIKSLIQLFLPESRSSNGSDVFATASPHPPTPSPRMGEGEPD